MESENCLICTRIDQIKDNANPYFVSEMKTGYVVIGDHQYFKGYTLFLAKQHLPELHLLKMPERVEFLKEMSIVAEAVIKAFKPVKLNYELLGNSDRHMHWHLFPRYGTDPAPKNPIWEIDRSIRASEQTRPSFRELEISKAQLRGELNKIYTD